MLLTPRPLDARHHDHLILETLKWLKDLKKHAGEEMELISLFYIVDEPDIWDMTAEQIGGWISEFKSVFPNVPVISTYAVVARSTEPNLVES